MPIPLHNSAQRVDPFPPVPNPTPGPFNFTLAANESSVIVNWEAPTAVDNRQGVIGYTTFRSQPPSSLSPGNAFGPGSWTFIYTFSDNSGNLAFSTVNVTVLGALRNSAASSFLAQIMRADLYAPVIYNCPSNASYIVDPSVPQPSSYRQVVVWPEVTAVDNVDGLVTAKPVNSSIVFTRSGEVCASRCSHVAFN
jgi:hypothetical protein